MNMPKKHISTFSVLDKRSILWILGTFTLVSILLTMFFIEIDAFERFFNFSRHHESWELDEVLLALLSVIISFAIVSLITINLVVESLIETIDKQAETEKKLLQNRKIQSMGSMLGGVAHSMNNHLQPILTLSRLVKNDLPENSPLHEDLNRIGSAAANASQILQRILSFAHLEQATETKNNCNIASTTEAGINLAETTLPSSITVEKHIHATDYAVGISGVDLEIIILNLFSNAVDAMNTQIGKISVSLFNCDKYEIDEHELDDAKTWVCLKISDTGSGMSDEQKARMFDPFYTTKAVGKGTGLGLSENFGIVAQAGGAIDVETKPHHGTSVMVYLPLLEKASEAEEK